MRAMFLHRNAGEVAGESAQQARKSEGATPSASVKSLLPVMSIFEWGCLGLPNGRRPLRPQLRFAHLPRAAVEERLF